MKKASKENTFHYNPNLQDFAKKNKNSMTKGEACMWKYVLKKRMMKGYQFRRQRPVLNYIADFMCKELLLIIEVDGITHEMENNPQKDEQPDKDLNEIGFTTLRFSDWEVLNRIDDVYIFIADWIDENAICPPPPLRKRQREKNEKTQDEKKSKT